MSSIEEIYCQVRVNLTVKHVMTPRERFVYYKGPGYEKYDIVPVRGDEGIQYYYDTDQNQKREIKPSNIICSHVDLVELIGCLQKQSFFFVKDSDEIVGFVNISDLNTTMPLRLLLFTLISDIEVKLREISSRIIPDLEVEKYLGKSQKENIEKRIKDDKKSNIDVSPYEYFDLSYYFTLIRRSDDLAKLLCSKDTGISSTAQFSKDYRFIVKFRNRIAHSSRESFVEDEYRSDEEYIKLLKGKMDKTRELQQLLTNVAKTQSLQIKQD